MLRSGMILMIREKAQSGKSAYAIGKELNISKNTARKYIEWQGVPPPKIDRPSKLDSFKPLLHDLMSEGIFNCVVAKFCCCCLNNIHTIVRKVVAGNPLVYAEPFKITEDVVYNAIVAAAEIGKYYRKYHFR